MKRGFLATVALALAFGLTMGSVAFYGDAWAQTAVALRTGDFNDDGKDGSVQPRPGVVPFVVVPFSVTADGDGSTIERFTVVGTGGSVEDDIILKLSVYQDLNANGRIDFNDESIASLRNGLGLTDEDGDTVADSTEFDRLDDGTLSNRLSFTLDDETLAAGVAPVRPGTPPPAAEFPGETRFYMVVVDSMATYVDVVGTTPQDNRPFDFTVGVEFTATADGEVNADVSIAAAAKRLDVAATKLSFTSAASAFPQGQNTTFNKTREPSGDVTTGDPVIRATDDYGNLDSGLNGSVVYTAVLYASPGTSANATTHGVVGGTANLSNGISSSDPSFSPVGKQNITIVATHTESGLEGSQTVGVGGDDAVGSGALVGRGVEFYDVDHNGFLDRCTIFFNEAILDTEDNGLGDYDGFRVGGASNVFAAGTVPRIGMDNGGAGVRNAGAFGVTLFLKDDTYKTDARPQVIYTSFEDNTTPIQYRANSADISSIAENQATEADKARPVLFSARTRDTNDNGEIDQYVLTFSEPIDNFTKGGVFMMTEGGLSFGEASTFTSSDGVLTLLVNETGRVNTGVVPSFNYNENNGLSGSSPALVLIQDFAKDATGAAAVNQWQEDLTDYHTVANIDDIAAENAGAIEIPFAKRMDGVSPHVISAVTDDDDRDGKIDQITVEFSERMTGQSLRNGVSFADDRGNTFAVEGTPTLELNQSEVVYDIVEKTQFDTEARPFFLYSPSTGNVRDASGFELRAFVAGAASSVTATDGAAPHIVEAGFSDADADGLLDRVTLIFSEKIASKKDSTDYLDGLAVDYDADKGSDDRLVKTPTGTQGHLNPAQDRRIRKTDSGTGLAGLSRLEISFAERGVVSVDSTRGGDDDFTDGVKDIDGDGEFERGDNAVADVSGAPSVDALDMDATNNGDTGVIPAIVYDPTEGGIQDLNDVKLEAFTSDGEADDLAVEKDRAAPVIMSAETGDSNAPVVPGGTDEANGDGFIDMLMIKASEPVKIPNNELTGIQPFLTRKGDDAFSTVTIDSVKSAQADGESEIEFLGTSSKVPAKWDTGERPEIVYAAAAAKIEDKAGDDDANLMADQTIKARDRAKPVIVQAVGVVDRKDVNVRFSEPVGDEKAIRFDEADMAFDADANDIFGYMNVYKPSGVENAGAIAAAAPTDGDGSDSRLVIQVDNTLLVEDVEQDSIFILAGNLVYDFADDDADTTTNAEPNAAAGNANGVGVIVSINDAIAPYIVTARTVDVDGDGMIDHIRFQFSEPVDDETLTGYVTADSLTGPVSSVWDIADYTGEMWNLYDSSVAPTLDRPSGEMKTQAAIDGQPLFADNLPDDDVLYLMVDEGSGLSNPSTGEGDTHAAPGIAVAEGVTLVDFKPNTFTSDPASDVPGVSANVMSASDNAGPAIMSAMTTSTTTITTMFSEDVNDGTVATADFVWNMGAAGGPLENSQENVIAIGEVTPGVIRMETQPSVGEWPENLTGTIKFSALGVVADMSKITNGTRDTIRKSQNQADSLFVETVEEEGVEKVLNIIPQITVSAGATMVDAVDELTAMDYPNDNGGFVLLSFDFSMNHPGVSDDAMYSDNPINLYRIFRMVMDEDHPLSGMNVPWASVPAAVPAEGQTMMQVVVATVDSSSAEYTVRAEISPGMASAASNAAAAKQGSAVLATLDDGSAAKGLRPIVSLFSPAAMAAAIDNIAPEAAPFFTAQDAPGSEPGVLLTWTGSPSDRVVYRGLFNGGEYMIHGVTGYEVYRDGELIGTAGPGVTSFTDTGVGLGRLSDYMIYVVDGTEGHEQPSGVVTSISVKETERGNFNGDMAVDGIDLSLFAVFFGTSRDDDPDDYGMFQNAFDLNSDGEVDGLDLSEFADEFSKSSVAAKSVPRVESSYSLSDAKLRFLPVMDDSGVLVFLEVRVVDAEDLGAYAFDLVYDSSDLTYREGELGDWLSSNGSQGLLQFIQEVEEGRIRVFGAIAGVDRAESTVSGEGILARLMFSVHPSVAESAVVPEGLMVVDSEHDGAVIPLRNVSGGLITLLPSVYSLSQNHPNPFNPETTMRFTVPEAGLVRVAIYNATGQLVRQLMDKSLKRGRYTVRWDGRDDRGIETGSGIYFVRMEAGSFKTTKKMSLIK